MIYYCNNHSHFLRYYLWRRKKPNCNLFTWKKKKCVYWLMANIRTLYLQNVHTYLCEIVEMLRNENMNVSHSQQTISKIGNKNVEQIVTISSSLDTTYYLLRFLTNFSCLKFDNIFAHFCSGCSIVLEVIPYTYFRFKGLHS